MINYLKERKFDMLIDEPAYKYSTMRVGGNIDIIIFPKEIDEVIEIVTVCKLHNQKYTVIGNGSNIIFDDSGYDGIIICTKKIKGISVKNNILSAKCGTMIREVANFCLNEGLTGFENLCGIPATVGGAVYMNAGAYGSEIKDVIFECKVLDRDGFVYTLKKKDMVLNYRDTNFSKDGLIILDTSFYLKKGNKEEIEAKMKENDAKRLEKQPISEKSVGSTFKRPDGYFAGKLIEDAGLKGYKIGGAEVSTVHAGFVINKNNATAKDVLDLIEYVQKTVYDKYGVSLEVEPDIIGR